MERTPAVLLESLEAFALFDFLFLLWKMYVPRDLKIEGPCFASSIGGTQKKLTTNSSGDPEFRIAEAGKLVGIDCL